MSDPVLNPIKDWIFQQQQQQMTQEEIYLELTLRSLETNEQDPTYGILLDALDFVWGGTKDSPFPEMECNPSLMNRLEEVKQKNQSNLCLPVTCVNK